ncbi:hypothetical protein BJ742DRAFT_811839 [Cladochytrium replicatum]|nr:hypothetical protein BJ742DRAFT_811839 [Cladochytrium replicatum]
MLTHGMLFSFSYSEKLDNASWFRVSGDTRQLLEQGFTKYSGKIAPNKPEAKSVAGVLKKFMTERMSPELIPQEFHRLLLELLAESRNESVRSENAKVLLSLLLGISSDRVDLLKIIMPVLAKILQNIQAESRKVPEPQMLARVIPLCGNAVLAGLSWKF